MDFYIKRKPNGALSFVFLHVSLCTSRCVRCFYSCSLLKTWYCYLLYSFSFVHCLPVSIRDGITRKSYTSRNESWGLLLMFTISKFGVCVCWSGLDNGVLLFICVWSPSSLGLDGCLQKFVWLSFFISTLCSKEGRQIYISQRKGKEKQPECKLSGKEQRDWQRREWEILSQRGKIKTTKNIFERGRIDYNVAETRRKSLGKQREIVEYERRGGQTFKAAEVNNRDTECSLCNKAPVTLPFTLYSYLVQKAFMYMSVCAFCQQLQEKTDKYHFNGILIKLHMHFILQIDQSLLKHF